MVKKQAKQLLVQALMDLLEEAPLDKIDVRDMTVKAGLSRQTFYYNFKNKQDMVDWIFAKNNEKAKLAFTKKYSLYDYFLTALKTISQYRSFYSSVLLGGYYQNTIPCPFENGLINAVQDIEMHCASGRMNTEQWDALLFFSFGAKGMVMHWLSGEMRMSPEEMTKIILANMPVQLQEYTDKYRK